MYPLQQAQDTVELLLFLRNNDEKLLDLGDLNIFLLTCTLVKNTTAVVGHGILMAHIHVP